MKSNFRSRNFLLKIKISTGLSIILSPWPRNCYVCVFFSCLCILSICTERHFMRENVSPQTLQMRSLIFMWIALSCSINPHFVVKWDPHLWHTCSLIWNLSCFLLTCLFRLPNWVAWYGHSQQGYFIFRWAWFMCSFNPWAVEKALLLHPSSSQIKLLGVLDATWYLHMMWSAAEFLVPRYVSPQSLQTSSWEVLRSMGLGSLSLFPPISWSLLLNAVVADKLISLRFPSEF